MRTLFVTGAVLVAAALTAPPAEAQSIVELAQKEKERRKAAGASSRVITSSELGARSWGGAPWDDPEPPASTEADTADAPPEGKTEAELRADEKAEFQGKIDDEVARMGRIRAVMEESQRQLSDLTDLTFGTRRADLQRLIEQGEDELRKSEQQLDQIETDARHAGVRVSRPR